MHLATMRLVQNCRHRAFCEICDAAARSTRRALCVWSCPPMRVWLVGDVFNTPTRSPVMYSSTEGLTRYSRVVMVMVIFSAQVRSHQSTSLVVSAPCRLLDG